MYPEDHPDETAGLVTAEGLHALDHDAYHADPVPAGSISSSALKIMIARSPKHARDYQLRPRPPKAHFDLGQAVHTNILGGPAIVYWGKGDGKDTWKSGAAQDFRQGAYDDGLIPLLEDQRADVEGMVAALHADPDLAMWLEPGAFTPEQSGFWVDGPTGLWGRFRFDAAQHDPDNDTLTVVDLKTSYDVHPSAIAKAIGGHRYDLQRHHYEQGLRRLMDLGEIPDADIIYVLAFVESSPPYDVVLRRVGPRTSTHAARHWRYGMERFAECRDSGVWPGYDPPRADDEEIPEVEAPGWQLNRWDFAYESGDYDTTTED